MSTPPTVHDSDRKAGKECYHSQSLSTGSFDTQEEFEADLQRGYEKFALIIARHHAEERVAVEKAERALEDAKLRMVAMGWDNSPHYPQNAQAIRDIDAALTALRTASQ